MISDVLIDRAIIEKVSIFTKLSLTVETGGFLYGRVNPSWVYITDYSKPGPNAVQTSEGVTFDRQYIIAYTDMKRKSKEYVIGTWHTHPPDTSCYPSNRDIKTMKSFLSLSKGLPQVFLITMLKKDEICISFYCLDYMGLPKVIPNIKFV
ncbi:hypothetical protein GTO89_06800 [Heliobacterium gestii]|uniref:JAB1/MPN/MOV34 metalloenzyme domain-containing protein n=1 Tax=Heliomicrobium gestii TaxID=2699 RepID=A0A845L962_HELGE|nr:Mov34/MPN/PAD-1 family protein [Heliomicrobium gestii]MBM7866468.1 integrative and conjugative element protein (TIGR02256 family) [Heliomicrobium gestii]MZP42748.1 hypothetical protein [Heliomicrobium gestii]